MYTPTATPQAITPPEPTVVNGYAWGSAPILIDADPPRVLNRATGAVATENDLLANQVDLVVETRAIAVFNPCCVVAAPVMTGGCPLPVPLEAIDEPKRNPAPVVVAGPKEEPPTPPAPVDPGVLEEA